MHLLTPAVLLVLSAVACASSQNHGLTVVPPKRIGSVYLVPVFVPTSQQEYIKNTVTVDEEHYKQPTPLHRFVLGYSRLKENQYTNTHHGANTASNEEILLGRAKRSPGGGSGGGGGGGGGHGGGGSGSWSESSSSSSSGSWGGGYGGGSGHGGGQGNWYGKR